MSTDRAAPILADLDAALPSLEQIYLDLHAHPELSLQETRTAGIAANRLAGLGFVTTTGLGGTGVAGVLANGAGPVVLLRADMDALPVLEETGLEYASTITAADAQGQPVPVMHACGHDMHVACLLGAAEAFADHRGDWRGTLVVVFQPAEEIGAGARAMIDDGLFDHVPRPDVILGQHVAEQPVGQLLHQSGPILAAGDHLEVVLHGRGTHGSAPELGVDPILMAASVICRLQSIVSREVPAAESAVVTVGAVSAGTRPNIIPDSARLLLDVRTFEAEVRARVMAAIERIVQAEATAAGAHRPAQILPMSSVPATVNDHEATARVVSALGAHFGTDALVEMPPSLGCEDFGVFGTAVGAPTVFWFFGGGDPETYACAEREGRIAEDIPVNHSPRFAPVVHPTISTGVAALVVAAMAWLAP